MIHTAGVAHLSPRPGEDLSALFLEGNTAVTTALAAAVASSEVRVLVHLSSIAAAGYTEFSAGTGLSEDQAIAPTGPYGESKRLAEAPVEELRSVGKLGVNLRPPLIYGSGARGNWPRLLQLARSPLPLPFGSVRNRRSFLGIENLADLVLAILSGATSRGSARTLPMSPMRKSSPSARSSRRCVLLPEKKRASSPFPPVS